MKEYLHESMDIFNSSMIQTSISMTLSSVLSLNTCRVHFSKDKSYIYHVPCNLRISLSLIRYNLIVKGFFLELCEIFSHIQIIKNYRIIKNEY